MVKLAEKDADWSAHAGFILKNVFLIDSCHRGNSTKTCSSFNNCWESVFSYPRLLTENNANLYTVSKHIQTLFFLSVCIKEQHRISWTDSPLLAKKLLTKVWNAVMTAGNLLTDALLVVACWVRPLTFSQDLNIAFKNTAHSTVKIYIYISIFYSWMYLLKSVKCPFLSFQFSHSDSPIPSL